MSDVAQTKEKFGYKIDWKLYNFLLDRLTTYEDLEHFCYVLVLCGNEFVFSSDRGYFPYNSTLSMNLRENKQMKYYIGLMQVDNHMEVDKDKKEEYINSIKDRLVFREHFILGFK